MKNEIKQFRKYNRMWIAGASLLFGVSTVLTACASTIDNSLTQYIPTEEEYQKILAAKEVELKQRNSKDSIYLDAKQKAELTDNVLMYNISWVSVFYKYGSILHLLSVLQNNPNKYIYIYMHDDKGLTEELIKPILDTKKYPNLHVKKIPWKHFASFEYESDQILIDIKSEKNRNKKVDFYIDDFRLLHPMRGYFNSTNDEEKIKDINNQIFNNFRFLGYCRSINMFSDGSAAWGFWDQTTYNLMKLCEIWYDYKLGLYPKSNMILKEMQSSNLKELSFLEEKYSGGLLLLSLVTSNYKDDSGVQANKYFLPGTDTILDFNSTGNMNSDEIKRQVFDPYYSLNAGLIESYSFLNENSKNLFHSVFNVTKQSKDFMNNKTSIIYSGRNLADNPNILESEAKRIINIYEKNNGLNDSSVQVVFKGHPRDTDDYLNRLKNKIKELNSSLTPENWLTSIDRKIPMEYYIFDGFLVSDESLNRKVIYYSGYSTSFFFLQAAGMDKVVKNVIVSNSDRENVLRWNGYPSRVFKDGILLHESELDKESSESPDPSYPSDEKSNKIN